MISTILKNLYLDRLRVNLRVTVNVAHMSRLRLDEHFALEPLKHIGAKHDIRPAAEDEQNVR